MDRKELKITRVLNATIEKVWDAWTNPESMMQWESPENMTTPEAHVDLTVGGKWQIVMEGHDQTDQNHNGKMVVGGKFLEIEKPHKLVYTWQWQGAPEDTHTTEVSILLKKIAEDETELTLIHRGFPDDNMVEEHNMGWVSTFNKLEQFL